MSRLETVTEIAVRYAETDRMGVVHHSVYPVYFEVGRTDFFEQHLVHYDRMEQAGLMAPVIELQLQVEGAATYGDVLRLRTFPLWLKGVRLAMGYELHPRGSDVVLATGSTTHALLGPDRRPVHPRRFAELYGKLKEVFGE
ncbi:MAG: acyl-CoA thioesterase [Armatimonadetes bacterium]|nr:acyl-CoA thioesterase [Armatimonadota bacterium]